MQLKSVVLIFITVLISSEAMAESWLDDFTYGFGVGFGATGISEEVFNNTRTEKVSASRSEGPAMLSLSMEKALSSRSTLALAHRRGLRLGPLSAGVGFTGLIYRRYFLRNPSYLVREDAVESFSSRTWAPYLGFGGGFAQGSIFREDDAVPVVKSSGFYLGIHVGADYHLYKTLILRPEVFASTTLMDSSETPATTNEFGLIVNLLFRL